MKRLLLFFAFSAAAFALTSCQDSNPPASYLEVPDENQVPTTAAVATFAAGCFWCVEEVFQQQEGVYSSVSGYMGGTAADADYDRVSSGRTDHAEVVQVQFNPDVVSYQQMLDLFWKLHDPTQLNRQGPDHGRQYRSEIFAHSDEQLQQANESKSALAASGKHGSKPIATLIEPAVKFYAAEDYHQNFARINPNHPYLRQWLMPKLVKLGLKIPGGEETSAANEPKGSGTR
ncbi:MAG: peptide-methionine (S)-S-oxide reductase [Verrucomicrobiales bacterium]|jgi:peptide-methionine (S)-S-oxide reductase